MVLQISQKLTNFPKYDRNESFLDFCLVYIYLSLKVLKQIWDKFENDIFYISNFGNSVAESKLGAECGNYLLFHAVQGAHHSLSTLSVHVKRISQIYKS